MNYYVLKDNVATDCVYGVIATKIDSDTFNDKVVTILNEFYTNNKTDWMVIDLLMALPDEWEWELISSEDIENVYI